MRVVFLGGPLHRKRKILTDETVGYKTHYYSNQRENKQMLSSLYQFQSGDWNDISFKVKTTTYNILCGVKYYYGETIFVHEKFDIKKSKIIQKLEERQCYERSGTKEYQRFNF